MSWFDGGFLSGLGSLFGGGGGGTDLSSFSEPAALGTGSAATTASDLAGPSSWDLGSAASAAPDLSSAGGIEGANPSMFGLGQPPSQGTPPGMPQTDFAAPGAQQATAPATLGSVAPNQGGSVAGNSFGVGEPGEPGGPGG